MTLKEKHRKVKLIGLIVLCDFLLYKKDPPKTIEDTLIRGMDSYYWINQLRIIQSQPLPRFEKGSLAIVDNSNKNEIIKNN